MYTDEALTKRINYDLRMLRSAMAFAQSSKDPSRKVGAILESNDRQNSQASYNGFPPNFPDTEENWARPKKYSFVVHAETNALLRKTFSSKNGTMYVTCQPCQQCLKNILAAQVGRVFFILPNIDYQHTYDADIKDYLALVAQLKGFGYYLFDEVMSPDYVDTLRGFNKHDGYVD